MADCGTNCLQTFSTYCRTQKGFILAAEMVLNVTVLACYAASLFGGYVALATSQLVLTIIIFIVFMAGLDKQFVVIDWLWTDLIRAAVGAAVYMVTSLMCVTQRFWDGALMAGGVFGLIAAFLLAYDTLTIIWQIKSSRRHTANITGGNQRLTDGV